MTNDSDFRKIYTSKENFDKLRFDQKFARLLNLARTVNAVYFCFKSLLDHSGDETPAGQRQHINAFLFATGVLHEGFTVAERLEKHFGDRDSYRTGTGGKRKGTYYNLADEIVINYMLNDVPLNEQDAVFRATLKSIGESLSAF